MNFYRLTLRPPSIGCFPTADASGTPLAFEVTENYWPPRVGPDGRNHYATVCYPAALPMDRIWRYDLVPVDVVEAAHYAFWQEAHHDEDQAAELEAEWIRHGPHLLQALRDLGDTLAGAALTILEAQGRREESNG